MKKLLFSGELPPKSIHGVSYSNEINLNFLRQKFKVICDEEFVPFIQHKKFDIGKTRNFFKRIFRIVFLSLCNKFSYFYIVFSTSTIGALKTLIIISTFKCFNCSKVIVHIHRGDLQSFISSKSINKWIFKLVTKFTDSYIVLSENTRNYIHSNFTDNVHVLNNTVNFEYSFKKQESRIKTENFNFLYISNYIEEKGILLLLEVFHELPNNFKIHCYGNFTDPLLKDKIMSYKSANISINGAIDGRYKYEKINQSDALILPSYNEGKPLILLEAMSVGTAFIASDVGYISEMAYENYPYLYCPNSKEELLHTIVKFTNDTDIQQTSKKLRQKYQSQFSHKIHRTELLKIFK